jgi:hypothetical protein
MSMTLTDNDQQNAIVKVSVDSDEAYQRIDWLNGMEEQLTSVRKIKEHFLSEKPKHETTYIAGNLSKCF